MVRTIRLNGFSFTAGELEAEFGMIERHLQRVLDEETPSLWQEGPVCPITEDEHFAKRKEEAVDLDGRQYWFPVEGRRVITLRQAHVGSAVGGPEPRRLRVFVGGPEGEEVTEACIVLARQYEPDESERVAQQFAALDRAGYWSPRLKRLGSALAPVTRREVVGRQELQEGLPQFTAFATSEDVLEAGYAKVGEETEVSFRWRVGTSELDERVLGPSLRDAVFAATKLVLAKRQQVEQAGNSGSSGGPSPISVSGSFATA